MFLRKSEYSELMNIFSCMLKHARATESQWSEPADLQFFLIA